jgi:signal transduction histidine kinase
LEQAIRNILNNAIKHVKPGGEISVELKSENGHPSILISNEGDPIPEEDLPHIFDSFYQGSNKKSGAGLGLSISKHIISLHDGTISASNGNNGVTVKTSLP